MSVVRCSACGAELIPEANFCRQCGTTVSGQLANFSEEPTLALDQTVDVTTQRLDPRATSPGRRELSNTPASSIVAHGPLGPAPTSRRKFPMASLVGGVVLVIVIAIICSVAFVRIRSHRSPTDNAVLIYPGAQTVVDLSTEEGRAMHLQTGDSLDQVVAWYEGTLKPTKTMRLTSTSFVLRNQNVTATIVNEDNKTNILIKQSPTP